MAGSLAVAAVTRALAALLAEAAEAVPGARVTTLSPASEALATGDPSINLWLLAAVPDAAVRNSAPAWGEPGAPGLALTLSYLIGFYGDDSRLEPQRLLGAAAAALHFKPRLEPEAMASSLDPAPRRSGGDLPSAPGPITLRLVAADSEAIGRAWPGGTGAGRALALLCTAGPVILDRPGPPLQPPA